MASTITNFRPEVWAANLLVALRDTYVYASPALTNRDYEGDVAQAGDTVHITSVADPTIRDYTEHGTITWEQLDDDQITMTIDQADYFAFKVDDIERRQALPGFVEEATRAAGIKMTAEVDEYVSGVMVDGVDGTGNDIGAYTVDISDNTAWGLVVALRSKLNIANVPRDGRFLVIPDAVSAALLQDPRFVDASQAGDNNALRAGELGRIAGFTVYESNTVPEPTANVFHVLAGHRMATTFVDQINKVETLRLQDMFGDGVRGLHLYDAMVVRPEALALASVTVQA